MNGIKSKNHVTPSLPVAGHGVISSNKRKAETLATMLQKVSNDEYQRIQIREKKRTLRIIMR